MSVNRICSGTVLYNPNIELLKKHLNSIKNQVDRIYLVDNGSSNIVEISNVVQTYDKLELISNKKNYGIAKALNQLFEKAKANEYDWIITFDQDSICDGKLVEDLKSELLKEQSVGVMAPIIIDRNVGVVGHNPSKRQDVRTCITSGSLTSIKAWEKIGKYDEKMFIDSVDFEFCYRMRKSGFRVIQTPAVKMSHAVGEAEKCRFLFWTFRNYVHSPFRHYYMAQNRVYFPKKHRLLGRFIRGNIRNLRSILIVLLYEDNKKNKITNIIKGWKHGLAM